MPIHHFAKRLLSKSAWRAYNIYRKGLDYNAQFSRTVEILNAPRETIIAFQMESLERILQHAYHTTPYYRELIRAAHFDIYRVPPLEKQDIREQLDRLYSTAYTWKQRIQNTTGGSTGTPLTFYQDRNYWNQRNLSVYYFDQWAGWNFGEPQLVICGSLADFGGGEHRKHRFNNFWRNQYWLNGFQLTDPAMWAALDKMHQDQPQTILAYPFSLYQFAKFIFENGLTPFCKFKGIITSGEMLHPHYRALAEYVFKTKVYNRYGSREVGLIAMECAEGRMHINCRDLYLEIDSPDPYTEPGEILITQFNNYVMPFIRYRVGDVGLLSDEMCPCGNDLPILAELLGRTTATFRTRNGTLIHGSYFTEQFHDIDGVTQFQIIQESLRHCVLKVVRDEKWTETTRYYLVQSIQEALGTMVVVTVELVDEIPLPPSGKREYTISKVDSDIDDL
ncbi:phenylacetate--CoA ligase family protein [Candidatus Poribacteria bacterium]|nr:phenylacetate--CoA ligase family protein [Candidatus Poribacteria bacterium]